MFRASLAVLGLALVLAAPSVADDGLQAPDPGGTWEESSLKFSLMRSTNLAFGDPMPVGMTIELPSPSGGFAVKAEGGTVEVDLNGDGSLDTKAKEGKPVILKVTYSDGSTGNYAVRFYRGARMAWCYETATSMTGKVGGETLTLVDANCNGTFDEFGKDGLILGRAKYAVPLGRVISLKGKLYHLKVDPKGETVGIQEYTGATGSLDMMANFRAPTRPLYTVVQVGDCFFDASERGGITVPAGKYVFVKGRLEKGRKSCDISRGRMAEFEVAADGKSEPDWGPPLKILFKAKLTKDTVHIDAGLHYLGKAEEEYHNFQNIISTPDIKVTGSDGAEACKGRFATG